MLNLDPAKLLVIGLIAVVVLGPERLPKVARQLGALWREVTRIREQVTDEVKTAFPVDSLPKIPNVSSSVSSAVTSFTRPLTSAMSSALGGSTAPPSTAAEGTASEEEQPLTRPRQPRNTPSTRQAPDVVVHGSLGEFAFLPDDPSMN